jgi:rubrerythrin
MEGFDLRKFQTDEEEKGKIKSIMGKILSGRDGYEAIIETKKEEKRCEECNWLFEGGEKFCPECGTPARKEE